MLGRVNPIGPDVVITDCRKGFDPVVCVVKALGVEGMLVENGLPLLPDWLLPPVMLVPFKYGPLPLVRANGFVDWDWSGVMNGGLCCV